MHGWKRTASVKTENKFKRKEKNARFKFSFGRTKGGDALRTRAVCKKTIQNRYPVTSKKLHTYVEQFIGRDEETSEWHLSEPPKQTKGTTRRPYTPLAPPSFTTSPPLVYNDPAPTSSSSSWSRNHPCWFF